MHPQLSLAQKVAGIFKEMIPFQFPLLGFLLCIVGR
jgi:hypothetical protein